MVRFITYMWQLGTGTGIYWFQTDDIRKLQINCVERIIGNRYLSTATNRFGYLKNHSTHRKMQGKNYDHYVRYQNWKKVATVESFMQLPMQIRPYRIEQ